MACQGEVEEYPASDMRWGLAATRGAFSTFHIDSDGLNTYIFCTNKDGSKFWVAVGPKDKSNASAFSSVKESVAFHGGEGADAQGDVQVEAVLLRPGTRLCVLPLQCSAAFSPISRYMRPNTPHAVLTPDAAICHGGHYLSTSTIRLTCHGYLMGFSLSTLITNTSHTTECQLLFRKMLGYYYEVYTQGQPDAGNGVIFTASITMLIPSLKGPLETPVPQVPDVSNFNGLQDLFSLCNIVEMANILHPESYSDEGLRVSVRQDMISGRALSRAIVAWVISNYDIEVVSTETFYWNYLAYQAHAVCFAKKFGDSKKAYSFTGVPLAKKVQNLIESSFHGIEKFWEQWDSFEGLEPQNFAWPNDDQLVVKTRTTKIKGAYTLVLANEPI